MTVFNIHEAKAHFSKLLERVLNCQEVVIAKARKPVHVSRHMLWMTFLHASRKLTRAN
jgi:hypothetical protein